MIIDHFNLNHLRVFECVYRTQSMTLAAQQLHLTQSGVSQHIKSLEEMLDIKLFDRISQKLVPTSQARVLFENSTMGLKQIEHALLSIKASKGGKNFNNQLMDTISIGMPLEFGHNVILPLLAQFCKKHPLVKLNVRFDFASGLNSKLLEGSMDFAFIDDFRMDRRMHIEKVYDEVLELCMSEDLLQQSGPFKNNRKYYESLTYVDYQENAPILRMWFRHHLSSGHLDLNVRAVLMDVQAVSGLILAGTGAGVIPEHLLTKLRREGHKLHRFKGSGKPLQNTISLAFLESRTQSPTVVAAIQFLRKALLPQS